MPGDPHVAKRLPKRFRGSTIWCRTRLTPASRMASGPATTTCRSRHRSTRRRSFPRRGHRRDHRRGSGTSASLDDPAPGLLEGSRLRPPIAAFDREIAAILVRDGPRLVQAADDMWPDQDDQLGLADRVVLGTGGVPQERDVPEDRDLAAPNGLALLEHSAQHQRVAVVHHDAGPDLALADRRRVDA